MIIPIFKLRVVIINVMVCTCSGLPSADDYSPPDAFAKLWSYRYDNRTSQNSTDEPELNRFGTTAAVMNTDEPKWPEVFTFWYEPGTGQVRRPIIF